MARKKLGIEARTESKCTGNGFNCEVGKPEQEDKREITIFTAKWCGACKKRVPTILKKAQVAGLKVNLIDIDEVDPKFRKMAGRVQFVPQIDYKDREIDEDELDLLLKKASNGAEETNGAKLR